MLVQMGSKYNNIIGIEIRNTILNSRHWSFDLEFVKFTKQQQIY